MTEPTQTRDALHQHGEAVRTELPRSTLAGWMPVADRADPVDILIEQGKSRIQSLLPIRYARMQASPLAFLRGAAAVMAADLGTVPRSGLVVQSCGDCHLANFGSYASPEGFPVFDINDFDETLPAPFEWDVKRLATSLVLSGRENDLGRKECLTLAAAAVTAYQREVLMLAALPPIKAWSARISLLDAIKGVENAKLRKRMMSRLEAQLKSADSQFGLVGADMLKPHFKDKPPLVMRLPEHDDSVRDAFAGYLNTLPPERRVLFNRYALQDVIFKVVGVGSVGTFCAIGLFSTADEEPLLLQIKEAQHSVLAPYAGASSFANQGERVVTGQRIMQAQSDMFLGWTQDGAQASAQTGEAENSPGSGRQFYVRRMKDARLAAIGEEMQGDELGDYAALCGRALGRAHARSGNSAVLAGYMGKGVKFANAITEFAGLYADQTERDWSHFCAAIKSGKLPVADHDGT